MLLLPKIDPKRKNYDLFDDSYNMIRGAILFVMTGIYGVTTAVALGYSIRIDKVVPLIVAVLFVIIGNYMGKIRQNFFVGVKTPWTISDPEIWTKTHRLSGKVWTIGGLVLIITSLALKGSANFIIFMIVVFILAFVPIIYSYFLYKKKSI